MTIMDGFNIWLGEALFGFFTFSLIVFFLLVYFFIEIYIIDPYKKWKTKK